MAPFLHRHRPETFLYALAAVLGVLGAVGYAGSYFSSDWAVRYPVLPFFLVLLAGSLTLTAVTLSLVRLFHQDRYPEDPLDPEAPSAAPAAEDAPRSGSSAAHPPR
ncbi:hypothetical protein EAE32_09915 [Kocuria tytonicola]|uniref:Uncharacterized protein n=1 Tax=Kocuria tytonicola TaxID=2055946 RepID=A0A3L9KYT2_9MICC|nr:hypothetical protein [Kocuria tytonicola]RLY91555.1 hypothetical protein EAE32_09915 [Kocuria tytonicola]